MDKYSNSQEDSDHTTNHEQPCVVSTPEQVLTGSQVGLPDLSAVCACCDVSITEGQASTIYAYRPSDVPEWNPARCYCQACVPNEIPAPTNATSEVLVQAWLGVVTRPHDRSHRLCLLEVELMAFSPPTEGSDP